MYDIQIQKLRLKENETLDSIVDRVDVVVNVLGEGFWVSVNLPDPDPENFIALENITDEMVNQWVWENIDLEQIDSTLLIREKEKASTAQKTTDPETSITTYTVRDHVKQWKIGKQYAVDDICYYEWEEQTPTGETDENGDPITTKVSKKKFYRCVQAHTSQAGWNPRDTAALFTDIVYFGDEAQVGYPDWKQPQGAHDAYLIGSIVEHNGETYISDVDANVWEPPTQWSIYTAPAPAWEAGINYVIDDVVTYNDVEYTCISDHTSVEGETPDLEPTLWTDGSQTGSSEWEAGVAYAVDDTVTYNSVEYVCIQAHTSQVGWEPPNVPSLWSVV